MLTRRMITLTRLTNLNPNGGKSKLVSIDIQINHTNQNNESPNYKIYKYI